MVANRTSVALLLAGLLVLPVCAEAQEHTSRTVRKHRVPVEASALERAEAALEKQQYAEAEELLNQAVESDPEDYVAWFHLGYLYTATDRGREAIAAYRRSVEAKPDLFESNLNLGLLLVAEDAAEAERFLRAATRLKPSSEAEDNLALAWLSLGRLLAGSSPQEALAAMRQASRLQPQNAEPRFVAATLLESTGDLAGAEAEYKAAHRLQPGSPGPVVALAKLYVQTERLPEAATALRRYLELNPGDDQARLQLARIMAASGEPEEALAAVEELQQQPNPAPEVQRELAALYLTLERFAEAETHYRALLSGAAKDPQVHHQLGVALMKQRKFTEAQEQFVLALKLHPGMAAAYGDLAVVASENKNYALTIQALDARARYLPESPATYFLRATAYDHLKAREDAAKNYRAFLAVADGQYPDQEWQARHRLNAIEPKRR